jgi:hypothetical protein
VRDGQGWTNGWEILARKGCGEEGVSGVVAGLDLYNWLALTNLSLVPMLVFVRVELL